LISSTALDCRVRSA